MVIKLTNGVNRLIQFYISIIFSGIVLIIVALVSVLFDRKKSWDFEKRIDEKKQELLEIISDAEEMVSELNRISDYIVAQVNAKNDEILQSLRRYESKVMEINSKLYKADDNAKIEKDIGEKQKQKEIGIDIKSDLIIESINVDDFSPKKADNVMEVKSNEKVIPINAKHREVLQLAEKGLTDTEIAKRLNMGKGEIQLILDLNR